MPTNEQYQYVGKPLTPSIARELIQELFAGQTVQKQDIVRDVDETHRERGGHPAVSIYPPVTRVLSTMKQEGQAENPSRGIWFIPSEEPSLSQEPASIKTLSEFTEWAKKFTPGDYVFRGVKNKEYGIQASAYRRPEKDYRSFDKFLQINEDLIDEAKLRGYNERDGRPLEDLEILVELQHYGAATCLIDFSYSAQVALWFACKPDSKTSQDSENPPNGKVFAVYHRSSDFEEIKSKSLSGEISTFLQDGESSRLYHWQPRQQNNRIIAQQSIFLFGRYEFDPYNECVIEGSSKKKILTELQQVSGITEAMLFPDFDGFARLRGADIRYTQLMDYEHRELADEQFQKRNYSEAINHYDRAIAQNPGYTEAYYRRGLAKYYQEQYTSAISDFDVFINRNSNYAEAYYYRAESRFNLRLLVEAKEDLEKALPLAEKDENRRLMSEILILLDEIDSYTAGGAQDE